MATQVQTERVKRASKARTKVMTYWITRDTHTGGELSKTVDVWLMRPTRYALPEGGAMWMCPNVKVRTGEGDVPARFAQWTLDQCFFACRTIPDDDRMCVRVGDATNERLH